MAKPDPKSKDLNKISKGVKTVFHVEGANLEDVDYVNGGTSAGHSDVKITSTVVTWYVFDGKSQGADGKKLKIQAKAEWDEARDARSSDLASGPVGILGTGDMTITITNSGNEQGVLKTTIDYA